MTTSDLVGVWRLISFHDVDDEGNRHEGPLGPNPGGMLFYSVDGHVSVSMMRAPQGQAAGTAGRAGTAGTAGRAGPAPQGYMSYAGTWRRSGEKVFHTITVAPDPLWLGTEQVRDLLLDGDRLTLCGNSLVGRPQRRILEWERIGRFDGDLGHHATP